MFLFHHKDCCQIDLRTYLRRCTSCNLLFFNRIQKNHWMWVMWLFIRHSHVLSCLWKIHGILRFMSGSIHHRWLFRTLLLLHRNRRFPWWIVQNRVESLLRMTLRSILHWDRSSFPSHWVFHSEIKWISTFHSPMWMMAVFLNKKYPCYSTPLWISWLPCILYSSELDSMGT